MTTRPRRVAGALGRGVALAFTLYAGRTLSAMAEVPQDFAARWYDEGGLRRTVQVAATDLLGVRGVLVVVALAAVACVGPRRVARALSLLARGLSALVARVARTSAPAFALAFALAPAPAPAPSGGAARLNVLLVSIDGLRADRLDPRITPNLARLAERGARFDRAYVSVARAWPSWVSLLTGRDPHHHGIRSRFASAERRGRNFDALAARFAAAGYRTTAVTRDPDSPLTHLGLGFAHIAGDIEAELRAAKGGPFFLALSLAAPGAPYAAPAPYYAKYTDASYRGPYKYAGPTRGETPTRPEDVAQIRALYDGAMSAADAELGRALAALEELGLERDTVIVVTSTHGESLGERGRGFGHGAHLAGDEEVHVPLVVVDPREGRAARDAQIARQVDVAPTLYALAGVAAPEDLDGRSLVPSLRGDRRDGRVAFAETGLFLRERVAGIPRDRRIPYPEIAELTALDPATGARVLRPDRVAVTRMARHRMARDPRFKLVYAPTRAGAKTLLFDTLADPEERRDVSAEHPADVARLGAALWAWMLEDPAMEPRGDLVVPLDPPARSAPAAYELVRRVAPARLTSSTFHLRVPRAARIVFEARATGREPGTLSVTDALAARTLCRAPLARAWTRVSCDLAGLVGQALDLGVAFEPRERAREPARGSSVLELRSPMLLAKRAPEVARNVVVVASDGAAIASLAPRGVLFERAYAACDPGAEGALGRVLSSHGVVPRDFDTSAEAAAWLGAHPDTRFVARVRGGSATEVTRALEEARLSDRTIVAVTTPPRPGARTERGSRGPLLLLAPELPAGAVVRDRVRAFDLAPTVLELLGLPVDPAGPGRSLVALARGAREPDERPVVTEHDVAGTRVRALLHGPYRLVASGAAPARLYDLATDPGERHDLAQQRPDVVAEMRARLAAALANVPVAGSAASVAPRPRTAALLRLRFAGGPSPRRVSGTVVIGDRARRPRSVRVEPVQVGRAAFDERDGRVELAFSTSPDAPVGFDVFVDPPDLPVTWSLYLDDAPWPEGAVFAGPFGLAAPALARGLAAPDGAPLLRDSRVLPAVDPRADVGLFVTRARLSDATRSP